MVVPPCFLAGASAVLVLAALLGAAEAGSTGKYARVFSFGDSLTDTGNALRIFGEGISISRPPYGKTFFGRPSGRASDGRLAIDFIVEALGVPQPTAYAAGNTTADFLGGVNFAVASATALDPEFLVKRGLKPFLPVSLRNQTTWFKHVFQLLGRVHGHKKIAATSLFVVGEIGANDYLAAIVANRTVGEMKTLTSHIIASVRTVITEVIGAGARTVVVPGMIPVGCEPLVLALYQGRVDAGGFDPESGCIKRFNGFAELHNRGLRRMLGGLRRTHPGTTIVFADLYRAVTDIVMTPRKYGFRDRPLEVCCRGRGPISLEALCGAVGTTACADPLEYVSWDGVPLHGGRQPAHRMRHARGTVGLDGSLASQDRVLLKVRTACKP